MAWARDRGFNPPEIPLTGSIIRFGKDKSQWFIGHEHHKCLLAFIGDWKTGEQHRFLNRDRISATLKEKIKTIGRKINEEQLQVHALAKEAATKEFQGFTHGISTPYTIRKKIKPVDGTRVDGNTLIIPLRDIDGTMWTFQRIFEDGEKRFFAGGKKKGCFFAFGELKSPIYLCEGYATGYSLHEAIHDGCVVAAIDAGNMVPVAEALKNFKIVFAADKDASGIGEKKAKEAAEIVGGSIILPPNGFKDFNDAVVANVAIEVVGSRGASFMRPFPHLDDKDSPISTPENLRHLLNWLGVRVRYNIISKNVEISIPGQSFLVDDRDNANGSWIKGQATQAGLSQANLPEYTALVALENHYNPIAEWLLDANGNSIWDKKDRTKEFFQTITATGEEGLKETFMVRWALSAIASAFEMDGASAHGVLVLQGPQGIGKTSWFKGLVPRQMKLIKDGYMLRPDKKDSVKTAISHWLVELGELDATFTRADIAQLKAFITTDFDVFRMPYMPKDSQFPRRTVFCGSVNETNFLRDQTGNRRFWTIECVSIDYNHGINMRQFWAQIYTMYKDGEPWVLQPDELEALNVSNEKFTVVDPIAELLEVGLDWDAPSALWSYRTSTELLMEFGYERPQLGDKQKAGSYLTNSQRQVSSKLVRGYARYLLPPKIRSK